jgi:hypothetical protein
MIFIFQNELYMVTHTLHLVRTKSHYVIPEYDSRGCTSLHIASVIVGLFNGVLSIPADTESKEKII